MERDLLKKLILEQAQIPLPVDIVPRQIESVVAPLLNGDSILIITGVRRCGKSILLKKLRKQRKESDYYINFDDDRLVNFTLADFQTLYEVFIELFGNQKSFYFDEIQIIDGWERFVRRLYEEGNKIFITGSNASMLSKELGTRLTGRHISITMYPFSFYEFVVFKDKTLLEQVQKNNYIFTTQMTGQILRLFADYVQTGGIPEYVRNQQTEYIHSLFENIIYKDIIVRYNLTKEKEIKQLAFFIASNIGKNITYNAVRKMLGLGNASTIAEYYEYFANSFLAFLVNKYDASLRKQIQNEKKQYIIDHGLARLIGFRASDDIGRILENIIYIELLRRRCKIYSHEDNGECDFVLHESNRIIAAIQVCKTLDDPQTKEREYKGLINAMRTYNLTNGLILTENQQQTDTIIDAGNSYTIHIMPIWQWLLNTASVSV